MFRCYDKITNRIEYAEDIYDANKIFYCPNPNCNAQFKIKSVHGIKQKHFYRFNGANDHILNCPYSQINRY